MRIPHGIPIGFRPDYGLYIKKTGWGQRDGQTIYNVFVSVPVLSVAKVEDGLYCINALYRENDQEFIVTFDFSPDLYQKMLREFPIEIATRVEKALSHQPFQIGFQDTGFPAIGVVAILGDRVHNNENESYCPFLVQDFG